VARVIVDVMPKLEILDPQGQAIVRALPGLGFDGVVSVRQGKRFELEIEGNDPAGIAQQAAEAMLANPATEDFVVRVAD
jgi:phosphoribosylformylglycinamidine synthase subunit PurS